MMFRSSVSAILFLSTPSARRATGNRQLSGRDQADFYPRPPRGGRPETPETTEAKEYFYPRPPRGGRPLKVSIVFILFPYFYPRPPRGGRQFLKKV